LFVAVHDGTVVGHADCHGGASPKNRHTGLIGIVIREGWREAGLGRILMNRVLEWMRARGFEKAHLEVFSTHVRARRLYESLGFQLEGARKGHFKVRGEYVDDVIMGLWLK
jgi:RimJ/RimL family protein N-acetyltransferase